MYHKYHRNLQKKGNRCSFSADSDFNFSENHKFIHLPFSLEVKCEGLGFFFRTEQASTSVTCLRAAEQKHIGVKYRYIYIFIYL